MLGADPDNACCFRPYSETRDFAALTDADLLNVSVNIYDDGKVVQLVTGKRNLVILTLHFEPKHQKSSVAAVSANRLLKLNVP